jgi:hypothetical protein
MWKSATSNEPQTEEVRFMGPTCFAVCYGKKLEPVEYPTYFSLATEAAEKGQPDEEVSSATDNRVVRKDVSICTRMWNILSPAFDLEENLSALGLDALNVLLETKEDIDSAKEVQSTVVEQVCCISHFYHYCRNFSLTKRKQCFLNYSPKIGKKLRATHKLLIFRNTFLPTRKLLFY